MADLKRIYVSTFQVSRGVQHGTEERPITVEHPSGVLYSARDLEILGPSRIRYAPDAPNPAGARVWIETTSDIAIAD